MLDKNKTTFSSCRFQISDLNLQISVLLFCLTRCASLGAKAGPDLGAEVPEGVFVTSALFLEDSAVCCSVNTFPLLKSLHQLGFCGNSGF